MAELGKRNVRIRHAAKNSSKEFVFFPHIVKFTILAPLADKKMPHAERCCPLRLNAIILMKGALSYWKISVGTAAGWLFERREETAGGLGFIAEAPLPHFTEQKPWRGPDGPRSHH